jgi:DNA-binding beta-propeller fold protein YncE
MVVVALAALLVLGALAYPSRYLILSRLHVGAGSDAGALGLRVVADVPLEGGASRFDYQSLDAERGLLFIAHLGADQVVAFDVRQQKVAGYVRGVPSPHGLLVVPEAHRVFVSATGAHQLAVVDEDDLRVAANVSDAGDLPDGVAYDAGTVRVLVSDESGGAVVVIDARTDETLGRIDLGGEAGNVQEDAIGKQVVAAAQGRGELALLDPAAMRVTASIALPGCDGPHGFYVDAPARRAYVSCEEDARLVVVDLDAKREVAGPFAVGEVPDVLAFDPGLHRLYVASESGVVATFDARDGTLSPRASAYLAPAAHSIAVDPATHRVFVPLEDVGGRPVLRILEPAP